MKRFFKNYAIIVLFFTATVAVLIVSIFSSRLITNTTDMLVANTRQRITAAAVELADAFTAVELEQFVAPDDMNSPGYEALRQELADFAKHSNVLYAYFLRPYGDGQLQFVADNDPDPETQVTLYDIVDMEPVPQLALDGTPAATEIGDYSVAWDGIMTAYAPLYAEDGSVYCIAGVDVSDDMVLNIRTSSRILTIFQIFCVLLAAASGMGALILYGRKARQSESANVAKSQFLSRMSHEIRTPMNAIIGLCRMAKASDDIGQIKGYLDNINTSSAHLLSLINDILDLSKIESGKVSADPVPVVLLDEINSTKSIVEPQISAKRQNFRLETDPELPEFVFCDSTHLSQVVVNLLGNAIKFTPSDGDIAMAVRLLEQKGSQYLVEWRVSDTGIGIGPDSVGKMFEPFEQGDSTSTRQFGGTGLGLAIAKQLVEMMGGTIGVNSTVGVGSEFYFSVWLHTATAEDIEKAHARTDSADKLDLTGMRVLLVEDSEINQLIAGNLFSSLGAQVDVADNGQQAVDRFEKANGRYNLIFMDVQMPVMDGYEATRCIRRSQLPAGRTVPIIAMTANVFREDVQKALDSGMNAHVGKPFEVIQVEEAIVDVLNA